MNVLRRIFSGFALSFPFITRRRAFFGRAGYGLLAWIVSVAPDHALAAKMKLRIPSHKELPLLTSLADAIVPRDDLPGAIDSLVPQRLAILLRYDRERRKLYERGLRLLDTSAWSLGANSFHQLDIEGRIKVLKWLEQRQEGRVFVSQARDDVMRMFYAFTVGQRTVGYRPPQQGYLPEEGAGSEPVDGSKP